MNISGAEIHVPKYAISYRHVLLKTCKRARVKSLQVLFQCFLACGKSTTIQKRGICPVHEGCSRTDAKNCRPNSLSTQDELPHPAVIAHWLGNKATAKLVSYRRDTTWLCQNVRQGWWWYDVLRATKHWYYLATRRMTARFSNGQESDSCNQRCSLWIDTNSQWSPTGNCTGTINICFNFLTHASWGTIRQFDQLCWQQKVSHSIKNPEDTINLQKHLNAI